MQVGCSVALILCSARMRIGLHQSTVALIMCSASMISIKYERMPSPIYMIRMQDRVRIAVQNWLQEVAKDRRRPQIRAKTRKCKQGDGTEGTMTCSHENARDGRDNDV